MVQACERLTGYTREELVGMDVRKLLTDEFLSAAREIKRRLIGGEVIEHPYEQRIIREDGTTRIWDMSTSLVVIDGKVKGFQHVARDVTEEKQMQENLRFYVQRITSVQEDERKRIARELHDEASPHLLLLLQRLDAITSTTRPRLSKPLRDSLEGLRQLTVEALEGLRRCAQDLRPRILDDLGLLPALEWMTEDLVKSCGIDAHVEVVGSEWSLPAEVQLLLFCIAQEALSNIRRHAEASRASITVEFSDDNIVLTVNDNGKGFELPQRIGDLASAGKLGLAGMQERARLIRGRLTLQSALGKGTTVTVEVPLNVD